VEKYNVKKAISKCLVVVDISCPGRAEIQGLDARIDYSVSDRATRP